MPSFSRSSTACVKSLRCGRRASGGSMNFHPKAPGIIWKLNWYTARKPVVKASGHVLGNGHLLRAGWHPSEETLLKPEFSREMVFAKVQPFLYSAWQSPFARRSEQLKSQGKLVVVHFHAINHSRSRAKVAQQRSQVEAFIGFPGLVG